MPLDLIDRAIVRATQAGLPLCREPYAVVAAQLGLAPADVMLRLQRMLASGVIRRIGAVPNHYVLGWRANGMSVWDVEEAALAELGPKVGALPAVSHCYRRLRRGPAFALFLRSRSAWASLTPRVLSVRPLAMSASALRMRRCMLGWWNQSWSLGTRSAGTSSYVPRSVRSRSTKSPGRRPSEVRTTSGRVVRPFWSMLR